MLTVSRLEHGQPHLRALADCAFPLTGNLPSTVCAAASTPRAWSLSSRCGTEEMAVLYVDGLDAGVFCCDAWVPDVDAAVKQPQPRNAGDLLGDDPNYHGTSGSFVRRSETVFPGPTVFYSPGPECGRRQGCTVLIADVEETGGCSFL